MQLQWLGLATCCSDDADYFFCKLDYYWTGNWNEKDQSRSQKRWIHVVEKDLEDVGEQNLNVRPRKIE